MDTSDDTPSTADNHSNGVTPPEHPAHHPSSFLTPSDFLPELPPSTEAPSGANGATASEDAPPILPPKPLVDAQGRTLNPRSCVTCRKRKVKCDKLHPCSNCSKAHIECIFPSPGRAPRKIRKVDGRDKELLERLRRLEGVVKGLGVDVPNGKENEKGDDRDDRDDRDVSSREMRSGSTGSLLGGANGSRVNGSMTEHEAERAFQSKSQWFEESQQGRLENRFGRLVVNEGKSRYVNNSFWANLSNEVEDLKGILNQSSDEEDITTVDPTAHQHALSSNHHGFIFGFSSQNVALLSLHPVPGQIELYWSIFKDRVDPLVKVLHIPTLNDTVARAASRLSSLSRGFECLLFSVYYAATTSLSARDCLIQLGEEKSVLLARYRFAVEQALARANFLTTEELVVLQSFVLFLICLRRNNDARVIWTLTGLVVRIAQTIGIHRDGSHFGLPPFEVEMRRRLWWQVCILDTRASEDHGCDPTIVEQSFDTKLPLNINDVDIMPDMKEFPPDRQGCTDMSFCLLRCEVANYFRRINYIPPGPPKACTEYLSSVTLAEKERWIAECHQKIEDKYLKHCDMSIPLFWVTATVARLMMSKMWLMVYHPFQRQDGGATLSSETKEKLFITSLENMEYSLLLETEARTMKWGWLFRTYIQWHALAFTLSELCHRTTGDMVERAWVAVEKTRDGRWGVDITEETNTGHLWRPLKKLYRKAKDARQRGLQEERLAQQGTTAKPPARTYSPNANPMFGHPTRPRVTRAPLSQAQLRRFTEGPTFGQAPLDKHELLRSARLSDAHAADPMDTAGLPAAILQPPAPQGLDHPGMTFAGSVPNVSARRPGPSPPSTAGHRPCGPEFAQNFLAGMENIDFHHLPPSCPEDDNNGGGHNNDDDDALHMDPVDTLTHHDPTASSSSLMDTSEDLDWANWDQLVRQFGMDIDSGPGDAVTLSAAHPDDYDQHHPAAHWHHAAAAHGPGENGTTMMTTTTAGMHFRMGNGMAGGDWF